MKPSPQLTDALQAALEDFPGILPADLAERCAQHWQLVQQWNARTNLTAIHTDVDAAYQHYRDSLEGLLVLDAGPVVDIGSGAGFPGIPLALARPDWSFTLLEPRRKRVSFLETAVARLRLHNVTVRAGRAEDSPDQVYAAAVSRATFSGTEELLAVRRWLRPGGRLLAYRAVPTGDPCSRVHRYALQNTSRVIEIWTNAV